MIPASLDLSAVSTHMLFFFVFFFSNLSFPPSVLYNLHTSSFSCCNSRTTLSSSLCFFLFCFFCFSLNVAGHYSPWKTAKQVTSPVTFQFFFSVFHLLFCQSRDFRFPSLLLRRPHRFLSVLTRLVTHTSSCSCSCFSTFSSY